VRNRQKRSREDGGKRKRAERRIAVAKPRDRQRTRSASRMLETRSEPYEEHVTPAREGTPDRRRRRPFTRTAGDAVSAEARKPRERENARGGRVFATGVSEARLLRPARGRERPASKETNEPAEAIRGVVKRRDPRVSLEEPRNARGAGARSECVGKQTSVGRISRSSPRGAARQAEGTALARNEAATPLARVNGGAKVKRCEEAKSAINSESATAEASWAT
jgi:hypothetical protein